MNKYSNRLSHYLPLIGIIITGLLGFVLFSYDKAFQSVLLVAVATSYVVWGVIHHKIHDDLYLAVVVEYIVIATLGLVIVFSLLFRA
ncbi:MAG: hypothetical protein PVJ52_01190 [Candidatus Woesebacteria bacterium]|jgi:hypothetical protein